jgi:hypothetical protein
MLSAIMYAWFSRIIDGKFHAPGIQKAKVFAMLGEIRISNKQNFIQHGGDDVRREHLFTFGI